MKAIPIIRVDETVLNQNIFGIRYTVDLKGVEIFAFTPSLLMEYTHQFTHFRGLSSDLKLFQVSLQEPFFLPLQTALNGSYEKSIFFMSEILKDNELINIIWIFYHKEKWKSDAIEMYDSYLKGNNEPSNIPLLRKWQNRFLTLSEKFSHALPQREYSKDVEDKILDKGYGFQCLIEIESKRAEDLANVLQDIFSTYDYHNGLRLMEVEYKYPYNLYNTNQLLSKSEMLSLFVDSQADDELSESPIEDKNKQSIPNSNERTTLLPYIQNKDIERDDTIISRLAESLKRVGLINQARLYNETVQYGSRLIIIHADIPKNKTFSDIEKKRKDIQVALGVESITIEQGERPDTIKYSIPHNEQQFVSLREIIERSDFDRFQKDNKLPIIVGLDEIGKPIYLSLQNLRHLLITGTTGSGKSVFVNQLVTTLLLTNTPEMLNFYFIDPKQVELQLFKDFPHTSYLLTDMSKSVRILHSLVQEMEKRYSDFKEYNVKNIDDYNAKSNSKKPYIVVVIEEYADLKDFIGSAVEEPIKRLGQKARAAGIHLILITQRPSATVLNSDIKANFINAISFNLNTNTNYKTVFGKGIPFQLLGRGDGVMKIEGYPKEFQRFQSPMLAKNGAEESTVISKLLETYHYNISDVESKDKSVLNKLKQIIATTKETRVTILREKLSIKSDVLTALMSQLVDEGWLIRHKNRQKGYELVADEDTLSEWRNISGD